MAKKVQGVVTKDMAEGTKIKDLIFLTGKNTATC
jgi:hypothetical protein